jgi:hypothetical protein
MHPRFGLYTKVVAALALPAALFASPMVEVDTMDAKLGDIIEGKVTSAKHVFKLRNTGDSALSILNVKPGWGCTSVGHDSIILPGREGTITAEVPLQNLHSGGEFTKYINVTTNAKNKADFRLSISGIYRPVIEFEPSNNVRLSAKKDTGDIVTIKTMKSDLTITDVTFKINGKELDFKAFVPIKFSLARADLATQVNAPPEKDKKDTGKGKKKALTTVQPPPATYVYKLRLYYIPSSPTDEYGEFVLKTNIPDKPEIKLSGILEAKSN